MPLATILEDAELLFAPIMAILIIKIFVNIEPNFDTITWE